MMASTRLTFLYPHLFRTSSGRCGEPVFQLTRTSSRRKASSTTPPISRQVAQLMTSPTGRQAAFAKRAGTGVEPHTPQDVPPQDQPQPTPKAKVAQEDDPGKQQGAKEAVKAELSSTPLSQAPPEPETKTNPPPETPKIDEPPPTSAEPPTFTTTHSPTPPTTIPQKSKEGPMETVLHMGPPSEAKHRPPHLTPPPYVHHFDSYSLVKQLTTGSYTEEQAITAMKAVRGLLSTNLDMAQESLVSKSDVENESYLFRAACSELGTEVKNNRRVADEHMRQQRTHLQHEVDILTQRLNQEIQTLNDSVRGMFNDRRMAVREEQKTADSAIQQINYKISVELNSDARSDIEGLRWVLIRRSAIGILFMAIMTLGTLRYANYVGNERKKEIAKKRRDKEKAKKHDGKTDHSGAPEAAEILAAG